MKVEKARATRVPVVSETELIMLLDDVEPGVLRGAKRSGQVGDAAAKVRTKAVSASAAGPWAGRSVLVLGGTPAEAAGARERVGGLGARVLVNLGARTTHALCLDGAENDRRYPKIFERGIPRLVLADLDQLCGSPEPGLNAPAVTGDAVVLGRGHVIDLDQDDRRLSLAASWQPPQDGGPGASSPAYEVDVVAFALRDDDRVRRDEDLVFYNQPSTPDGGIRLTIDGSCEQGVDLDLESLPEDTTRVRIAAAIDTTVDDADSTQTTFATVGAIRLSLTNAEDGTEIASATLDAATEERTLVLADLYQRGTTWRFRAVGQGYEHDLAQLATDHGIEVG